MKSEKSNVFLYLIAFIAMILIFYVIFLRKNENRNQKRVEPCERKQDIRRTPVVRVIEKVLPSVVNLGTRKIVDRRSSPWARYPNADWANPRPPQQDDPGYSIGSGSIINSSGMILTSAHVVSRAAQIEVTLHDGRTLRARTVAEDMENDIALLCILDAKEKFQPIQTVHPGDLFLGESVIAVGNPYGLDGTITVGVLSGIGRSMTNEGKIIFSDLLQTDASVFPGSSGGPLVNLNAAMLGMNIAIRRDSPRIGFAIPMSRIENILARWMIPDRLNQVQLGVVPGITANGTVFIRQIFPGSPASQTKLAVGQEILSFNGWRVHGNLLELLNRLLQIKAGDTVEWKVKEIPEKIRITTRRAPVADAALLSKFNLGLNLENLTPPLAKALNYPFESGVIVTGLTPMLSGLGISRGDLLIKLGQRMIYSLSDVAQVLQDPDYQKKLPAYFISISEASGGKTILREHRVMFHRK